MGYCLDIVGFRTLELSDSTASTKQAEHDRRHTKGRPLHVKANHQALLGALLVAYTLPI
jgi:hypothetical protein